MNSWFECACMARRLSSKLAWYTVGRVRACFLRKKVDKLMHKKISWSRLFVSKLVHDGNNRTFHDGRDAVATDIIHQHSGRLDYYKGWICLIHLMFSDVATGTLLNSIPRNLSGIGICGKNMTRRWNIASTFKPLLTDGGIMLIEVRLVIFPLLPTKIDVPQPLRRKWRSRYLRRLLNGAGIPEPVNWLWNFCT